jgi:hypothetical protein
MNVPSSFFRGCIAALVDLIRSATPLPQRAQVKVAATGNAKRK